MLSILLAIAVGFISLGVTFYVVYGIAKLFGLLAKVAGDMSFLRYCIVIPCILIFVFVVYQLGEFVLSFI